MSFGGALATGRQKASSRKKQTSLIEDPDLYSCVGFADRKILGQKRLTSG